MSAELVNRVEELRQQALAHVRANELERALEVFDAALSLASDDEVRELITINKADVLFRLERNAPEMNQLARIVMRPPSGFGSRPCRTAFSTSGCTLRNGMTVLSTSGATCSVRVRRSPKRARSSCR